MDESAIKTFREALEEGHENYHHVRVMVVGHHGAGKSSLTKRLLREKVDDVKSTDGVEIYTRKGRFQLSDHKWIKYDGQQGKLIFTEDYILLFY
jgi:predicted GTPase